MKRGRSKAVRIASSHVITTCATIAALLLFVMLGSKVVPAAIVGTDLSDSSSALTVAFLLNIALILFGWRRSKDLKQALDAYESAERLAQRNANTDPGTGLANRRELMRSIVDMLDAKGRARRIRVAAADPAKAAITERLTAYPTTRSGALPFGRRALESGAGVLVPEVPPGFIASIAENEEHLSLLRELAPRSYIAAPLFVEKRLLGAVVFISCGRRYAEEDLRVAADLTSRAARAT